MAADFDGFLRTVRIHCINASHRLLVDYIYDLLLEIDATGGMATLDQDRDALHARSVKPRRLVKLLEMVGVPRTTASDKERRIRFLAESRNSLEHNAGLATPKCCEYADGYTLKPGDPVPVEPKEVGESLAIVEAVVRSLNLRACKKYRL